MNWNKYAADERYAVFMRDLVSCQACKQFCGDGIQAAHVVKNTKAMRRKYGQYVMHNRHLLKTACSLECNNELEARAHKNKDTYDAALAAAIADCERMGLPITGRGK